MTSSSSLSSTHYSILPEVAQALEGGKPVVALESTVITHGLPFPQNAQLAADLQAAVRQGGCIPATIAILDGEICVGLDDGQLGDLAQAKGMLKISSRDIATAVAQHRSGGTTVAGTLAVAASVGIKVFATGGIGGVHRAAPFDVSADLGQLARSPLVVVCAGAKAILDIPATLEVLETNGIPVVGYRTDEFPAFYSLSSGLRVGARADTPEAVASLAATHWGLGFTSAVLLAVPPPSNVAIAREQIESVIQNAMQEVLQKGVHGQSVTPYLLRRVSELTGGDSLKANLGLLINNARVAAEIAPFFK
jgi:pseudouridine-5'-phosphate glycosidase